MVGERKVLKQRKGERQRASERVRRRKLGVEEGKGLRKCFIEFSLESTFFNNKKL